MNGGRRYRVVVVGVAWGDEGVVGNRLQHLIIIDIFHNNGGLLEVLEKYSDNSGGPVF